jgi:hypothetical protein
MSPTRASLVGTLATLALLLSGPAVRADDEESREDEMFGAESEQEKPAQDKETTKSDDSKADDPASREDDMFGGDDTADTTPRANQSGPSSTEQRLADALRETDNPLTLGGELYMRFNYNILDEGGIDKHGLQSPNLLQVYLDARPNDRVRGFIRGRLTFDPTIEDGDTDAFGQELKQLGVNLDQLWLKFDIAKIAYVTLGRQAIRWGSGRFWNPTDFLNQQARDPLAVFDERLGATLAKFHIPVESLGWNFYAVANVDGASSLDKVGGGARAEFLFAETELAASVAYRKDNPLRLGLDVSTALGLFDLRVEGAVMKGEERSFWKGTLDFATFTLPEEYSREDDWIPQITAGAEVSFLYTEQDSLILGLEYFFNDAGVTNTKLYPWLIMQGQYTPFYLGRHYVSGYLVFMQPGNWNDTTIFLSGIANLTDGTGLVRLDYQVLLLTYLQLSAFVTVFTGDQGEFHQGMDIAPNLVIPELENGIKIVPQRVQLGLWLTLKV